MFLNVLKRQTTKFTKLNISKTTVFARNFNESKLNKKGELASPPAMLAYKYKLKEPLSDILGVSEATRAQMTSGIWKYISDNIVKERTKIITEKGSPGEKSLFTADDKIKKLIECGENDLELEDDKFQGRDVMKLFKGNYENSEDRANPSYTKIETEEEFLELYGEEKTAPYREYFKKINSKV